jgi:hypothetical protein
VQIKKSISVAWIGVLNLAAKRKNSPLNANRESIMIKIE